MRTKGTSQRRRLARELRRLRERAGLTLDEAAPRLDWSTSKLGRIETAQQSVDVHGVRSMLDLYDVGGDHWTEIIELVREARQRGWWRSFGLDDAGFPALESDAVVVYEYQLAFVPGLLQTAAYARAVFQGFRPDRGEGELDRYVKARLFRQNRLTEAPTLDLLAIIDETALRRPVGGSDVMRTQLQHLVAQTELPTVRLQVVPISLGVHAGMNGHFSILRFGDSDEPDLAYMENGVGSTRVHKKSEVDKYRDIFNQLQEQALDPARSRKLIEALADDL